MSEIKSHNDFTNDSLVQSVASGNRAVTDLSTSVSDSFIDSLEVEKLKQTLSPAANELLTFEEERRAFFQKKNIELLEKKLKQCEILKRKLKSILTFLEQHEMITSLQAKISIIMEEEFKLFTEERKKLVLMNKHLKDELDFYKVCLLKLTSFVSNLKEGCFVEGSETSHLSNAKLEDCNFKMFFVSLLNDNEMSVQKSSPSISSDQLCRFLINSSLLVNPKTNELKFSESERVPESLQSKLVKYEAGSFTDSKTLNNQSVSTSFILDENKSEDSNLSFCEPSQNGTDHQILTDDQICPVLCQFPEEKQNSFKINAPTGAIENSMSVNERYQNTTKIKDNELIQAQPSNDLHIDDSMPIKDTILEINTECGKELSFSDQTINTVQNSEYNVIGKTDDSQYNNLSSLPSLSLAGAASASSLNEDRSSVLQSLDADEPGNNDLLSNQTTKKPSDVIKKTALKANVLRKNRAGYGRTSSKVTNVFIEVPKITKRPLTSWELEDYEKGNMTIRLLDLAEAYEAYKKDQENGKSPSLRLGEYITIPDNIDVKEATVTENDMLFSDSSGSRKVENPPVAKASFLQKLLLRKKKKGSKK